MVVPRVDLLAASLADKMVVSMVDRSVVRKEHWSVVLRVDRSGSWLVARKVECLVGKTGMMLVD